VEIGARMANEKEQQKNKRIRLVADRLCYVAEGQDGLRRRNGMWRADRNYWDKYDTQAKKIVREEQSQEKSMLDTDAEKE
jgi:hypothetical protein